MRLQHHVWAPANNRSSWENMELSFSCAAADLLPQLKGSQRCWSDTQIKVRKGTSGHKSVPPPSFEK